MKNITRSIIALFAVVALSCSVEDVQDRPVIQGVNSPVLTAPTTGASYVLKPENAASQVERFTWKSANYGGDIQITYAVEVDKKGNKFATPQAIGSVIAGNQVSVTVEAMNNAALALKATPFSPTELEVRVKSTAGAITPMFSNVIGIVVTPYTTESPKLYVIGGFLNASGYGADWTLATTLPALSASGYGKTDFEGYINFSDANSQYKFIPQNTSYDGDYGNATGPDGSFTGLLLQTGESNAGLPAPKLGGYYLMEADTKDLKYKATRTSWAVTGSGTPLSWPAGPDGTPGQDHDMTYNPTTKVWTVTLNLTANEIKFRANDEWKVNYGDKGADGILDFNSDNIKVPTAGNYTITLDLSSPRNYKYTLTKN
ncbi:MAG: hypothetical protein ACI87N_001486 [Flavobacteriales bacterium]|jgi:hypothetical protein